MDHSPHHDGDRGRFLFRPPSVGQELIMKKIVWAAAAAAMLATPAYSADLVRRQPVADTVFVPAAPAGVWTGFYLGAHLGAGFSSNFRNNAGYALGSASGFFGGLQGGYDYQINRVVLGLAGDISYGSISRRFVSAAPFDVRATENWQGSIRGRLGYAVQDNLLIYATGGLALGTVNARELAPAVASQSRTLTGWTLGAGGEYKFTPNWSALLEYRYTDLGRATYVNLTGAPRIGLSSHTIRTGINYRF
jgi:outer membrane immunogenic protein